MSSKKNKTQEEGVNPESELNEESVQATNGDGTHDLIKQLDEVQKQAERHKNDYLRAVADLDNMRRRMVREKEELRRTAAAGLIEELLPVMDNMLLGIEVADRYSEEGTREMVKGFNMVIEQMKRVLEDHGVKVINPKGETFDPNMHESVSLMPSDEVEEHKVIEVVRTGYLLNDRLLRPASVVVSSGPKE